MKFLVQVVLVLSSCMVFQVLGRNVPDRFRRQLSLTIIDDEETTPRTHPPSPEDLEERRQALIKALIPVGDGGGATQFQSLTDLGLDLVGGAVMNAGEIFGPLKNATEKARASLPRPGDVINRLVDSGRAYTQQVQTVLRNSASGTVNNAIRLFTTASARGSEVLGGVFKLMRSLLDSFTLAVQNLVGFVSRGLGTITRVGSQFATTNLVRARTALQNERLLQPAKDAIELGTNLVKGLGDDLTQAQPWFNDGVKSKLQLTGALVPRVNLQKLLSPLGDPEKPEDSEDAAVEISDGSNAKRDSSDSSESKTKSESDDDMPLDVLDLLESKKSELKSKPDKSKSETKTEKPKKKSKTEVTTTETADSSEEEEVTKKSRSDKTKTTTEEASSVDDLFGITSTKKTKSV